MLRVEEGCGEEGLVGVGRRLQLGVSLGTQWEELAMIANLNLTDSAPCQS